MNEQIEKFVQALQLLEPEPYEDITAVLYELVEPIEQLQEAESVIEDIFRFMERNPDADIGSPGPLVHLVEQLYPNYLEQLIVSIERQPTHHTLWIVNRVLNSSPPDAQAKRLVAALRSVQNHPNASRSVVEEAGNFLELQGNSG